MAVLVVVETLAIGLLGVLVAGLLRSHAEILRRLHHLGAGLGDAEHDHAAPTLTSLDLRAGVPTGVRAHPAIVGRTSAGDAVTLAVGRRDEATLLVFLSTGCHRCGAFWEALRSPAGHVRSARVVIVTRDAAEESPGRVSALAPRDIPVVMSSQAWDDYGVPGSPFAVYVDESGTVAGKGTASSWPQLVSLVTHVGDDRDHPGRVDRELQAAGLYPGDPSLHPAPGSLSRR